MPKIEKKLIEFSPNHWCGSIFSCISLFTHLYQSATYTHPRYIKSTAETLDSNFFFTVTISFTILFVLIIYIRYIRTDTQYIHFYKTHIKRILIYLWTPYLLVSKSQFLACAAKRCNGRRLCNFQYSFFKLFKFIILWNENKIWRFFFPSLILL